MATYGQEERIRLALNSIVVEFLGVASDQIDTRATFLEMGADSLILLQMSQAIQSRLGIKIPFRALMEDVSTPDALIAYIDAVAPPEPPAALAIARPPVQAAAPPSGQATADGPHERFPASVSLRQTDGDGLTRIFAQQLELMSAQLELLRTAGEIGAAHPAVQDAAAAQTARTDSMPGAESARKRPHHTSAPSGEYVPYRPVDTAAVRGLSSRQKEHLHDLIQRYNRKTATSKQMAQANRPVLADDRSSVKFRSAWKEIIYPVVAERAQGSRVWDVDGNEYVDLASGFGSLLYGHNPPFVIDSLREQLDRGIRIGFQSPLLGDTARLVCELTGHERAAFVNSGTEAVMSAIRLARTGTGRTKIALFSGAYHGFSDEALVRLIRTPEGHSVAAPAAPGISSRVVQDVVPLEYGKQETLEFLSANAHELAAVLIEPLQSRRPGVDPREFLQALRHITAQSGTALIFDEVVTGFRMHPGGMQALYGVRADICTYGKSAGGGVPVGIVAGQARFLNALDGGPWNFGDQSAPDAETTFLAGTYFKHPLTIGAVWASLTHLKKSGPGLQAALNQRTATLVQRITAIFERERVPAQVAHFGSLFLIQFSEVEYPDLFFFHLLDKGVYIWEGRTCYLNTAHTDADLDHVVHAVEETVAEMKAGGFLPDPGGGSRGRPQQTAVLPLTEQQKGMWALSKVGEDSSRSFNQSVTLRLRGALQLAQLRAALEEVVSRHEALRTTFSLDGERQYVYAAVPVNLPVVDLAGAPGDRQQAVADCIQQEVRRAFDLEQGPVWRAQIVRLDDTEHLLVLTIHHLVADGLSVGTVLQEIGAMYSASVGGTPHTLMEPCPFSQFVMEHEAAVKDGAATAAEDYWFRQFEASVPSTELPADYPRTAEQSFAGGRVELAVERDLLDRLRQFSARQGCTLSMTLLAAFEAVLHRLTGQADVIVGLPADGRFALGNRPLVGNCVTVLPLRLTEVGGETVVEQLPRIRRLVLDAYEHHNYSFRNLVKRLGLLRETSRPPLVTVLFNLDQDARPHFAGLDVEVGFNENTYTTYDLSLNAVESAHGLVLHCDYAAGLFEAGTVLRWLRHYVVLLDSMLQAPAKPFSELSLLTRQEQNQLAVEWNETAVPYARDACIHHLVAKQAEERPDAVAVCRGEQQLTYRELDRRANQLARCLRERGVGPESRVGLCTERSPFMLVAMLAVLKAGGAYVPLEPAYPKERLAWMAADAGLSLMLTDAASMEKLPPHNAPVLCLDAQWAEIVRRSNLPVPDAAAPINLAYIIYTSGSTGRPKGIEIAHRSVVNFLEGMRRKVSLTDRDVLVAVSTLSFDMSVLELLLPLAVGARVVLASREQATDGLQLAALLRTSRATVMQATLTTCRLLLDSGWQGDPGLKLLCGAEVLSGAVAHELRRRSACLHNLYGPTETTVWATVHRYEQETPGAQESVPVGRPIQNTRIYLLDGNEALVPVGVRAHLCIAGDGLARGYLGQPRRTAEAFVPDPYATEPGARLYRTGDVARYRSDGTIEYAGRGDHQVKVRGYRIELGEIEAVLGSHPAVRACAVAVREDLPGEKRLVAYVVPKGDPSPTVTALRRHLQEQLPDYMVPAAFVMLEALPLTPSGKLDRKSLPAPETARPELDQPHVAPSTPTERALAAIWQELLHVEQVGIHDDFFALSGDSILALRITARARTAGYDLRTQQIFRYPTIAQLAAVVAEHGGQDGPTSEADTLGQPKPVQSATSDLVAAVGQVSFEEDDDEGC